MGLFDSLFNASWDAVTKGFTNDPDYVAHFGNGTYYSDAALNRYFRDYDKSINLDLMRNQYELEKDLSSSAYQRAVADMKAAGINPAAMAGVNAQQASSPNISSNYHSSAGPVARSTHYFNDIDSLFNSILASDPQAAKIAAEELRDNAKHAHRMEELREKYSLSNALDKARGSESSAKASYYNMKTYIMNEYDRKQRKQQAEEQKSSGSKWYDDFKKKFK